jgi:membrane fusion protein, multidrug efflux system
MNIMVNRLAGGLAAAGLLLLAGCGPSAERQKGVELPPVSVEVAQASAIESPISEMVPGTVQSAIRSTIEARLPGRIVRLPVSTGERVERGQLLVELEAADAQARFEQAVATQEQADQDYKRFSQLVEKQAATPAEFDSIQARQRLAAAAVREAETLMNFTRITAPFDGVISGKFAEPGDMAIPGRPLLRLENSGALEVAADVSESLVHHLAEGEPLMAYFPAGNLHLKAVITEIAPAADPRTRTFRLLAALPDHEFLRPGQFARLQIPLETRTALEIPEAALVRRGQLEIVFLNENGRAQMRLVRTGRQEGGSVEILAGVEPGEWVITSNPDRLRDGQPLVIRP